MTPNSLRAVPLFESLSDSEAEQLCELLETVDCLPGQTLFRAGDAGDAMYLIERGNIGISVKASDGHELTIAELGQGEFFGEMAMIDGQSRSANATALEETRLATLTRDHFLAFIRNNSDVALEMLSALANRLRRTDELLQRRVARNVNEEEAARLTFADHAADIIAEFGGSWKFIIASIMFLIFWVILNTWLLAFRAFDAYPYILLSLLINMVTALQAPIIMMSQNRQSHKDRLRADLDYKVNLKNELALNEILQRLHVLERDCLLLTGDRHAKVHKIPSANPKTPEPAEKSRATLTLYLDEAGVRQHLRMADLIPAMERTLIDFSAGKFTQPVRSGITVDPPGGFFFMMPALADGLGVKIVTFFPSNAARGIPTHMATIFLVEPETGAPLAVMDGRLITEMRTAAVSAAATNLLASPDARILAILGTGVQARSHHEALLLVRSFEEVRVWGPTPANAEKCANEIGARAMPSAEEAVRGAHVIVTATSSKVPVLSGAWLQPGCHVNAVGACRPDWRELDDDAMRNVVFVDSRDGAMKESGDILLAGATIYAELGEALAGKIPPRANETTIFKSLGMAVEDIAAAMLVYRAAQGASE